MNKAFLQKLFESSKVFVSNAYVKEMYLLRACLVNFRTSEEDLELLISLVNKYGKEFSIK